MSKYGFPPPSSCKKFPARSAARFSAPVRRDAVAKIVPPPPPPQLVPRAEKRIANPAAVLRRKRKRPVRPANQDANPRRRRMPEARQGRRPPRRQNLRRNRPDRAGYRQGIFPARTVVARAQHRVEKRLAEKRALGENRERAELPLQVQRRPNRRTAAGHRDLRRRIHRRKRNRFFQNLRLQNFRQRPRQARRLRAHPRRSVRQRPNPHAAIISRAAPSPFF